MMRRGVNGDVTGTFFMLVEGITGTICLIITTWAGSGLYSLSIESFALIMVAACFAFSAIVMANYAISIGIAGVVLSIFNANASIHVILSAIFLSQEITNL